MQTTAAIAFKIIKHRADIETRISLIRGKKIREKEPNE